jgi:hypothetical protein
VRLRLRHVDFFLGGFALAAIAVHDFTHVREGRWYDTFWVCNLAALLVGPAALLRSPLLATISLTWMLPGTVVWLLTAIVGDANLLPTSHGVHLGGSLIASYCVWRFGRARRSLLPALVVPALAVLLSRALLPSERNVNAAYAIPRGFTALGTTFPVFAFNAAVLVIVVGTAGQLLCALITASSGRRTTGSVDRDRARASDPAPRRPGRRA